MSKKFETLCKTIGDLSKAEDYRKQMRIVFDSTGLSVLGTTVHGGETYTKRVKLAATTLDKLKDDAFEIALIEAVVSVDMGLKMLTEPVKGTL